MNCPECNRKANGLNEIRDFRGNVFSLSCNSCAGKIKKMLDKLYSKFGGIKGKCSCYMSPNIQSTNHLKEILGITD